jgi:predicted  nucleic acid-binding Zn-ribbon protein
MATSKLYNLQQVDTALAAAVAHRQRLDEGMTQRNIVASTTAYLEETAQQIAEAQSRQRMLELEIQSWRAKRAKLEREMYSGRVGNPKELTAMQGDAAAIGRHIGQLEDEEIGLMEQVESLEGERRMIQQQLEGATADLTRIVETFAREDAAAAAQIAELTARREALATEVEEDLLRRYERLIEKKGGLAVVAVTGGACGGCHVIIPRRLLARLERDHDLIATCDGCGRMLVVVSEA